MTPSPRWQLLAVTVALVTIYVTLAETGTDDGPRTFIAGLAAVSLGAWLYATAKGGKDE